MSDLVIHWDISVQEAELILNSMQELPMKQIALTHARLWQSSKEQFDAWNASAAKEQTPVSEPVSEQDSASS